MTFLKRRSRLLSFRVTQEEFDDLRAACLAKGARNVSDFARTALLQSCSTTERRLTELEAAIERNTQMMQALLIAPSRKGGDSELL
jgi:hypothetical protein